MGEVIPLLADDEERRRIQEDLDTTLVVEAAAGTGKTTALVNRMIAVLRTGRARLEQMVALTFTEKAAGEMKLRLRDALERARTDDATTEEERARFEAALAELEAAHIGTIHAFCADLLRERPVEAGVDPAFSMMADEDNSLLVSRAFDGWFEAALSAPGEGLRRMLRRRAWSVDSGPREILRRASRDLVERRDHPADYRREPFERDPKIDALMKELGALTALRDKAYDPSSDTLARDLEELGRPIGEALSREKIAPRDHDALEGVLRDLSKRWYGWNRKGRGREYGPGIMRADVLARRDAIKQSLVAFIDEADADLAACIKAELAPVAGRYEALKAKVGALDFLDLLIRVRDLLCDDVRVRTELQERYTHLFVDEFQDTDPLQAEILLLLASEDPTQGVWTDVKILPGKLFVVGDPKQAIYRFRRADVALYQRVKELLAAQGADVLHLSTSFRGVPAIQAAVNTSFAPLMQGAEDGSQAEYVPLRPCRGAAEGRPSLVALPVPKPYGFRGTVWKKKIDECVPDSVGAFLQWMLEKSRWTIPDPETRQEVPIKARHVCLLFRRFSSFGADVTRPYLRALEGRRIPHVLVGGRSFHDREEVMALRAALHAIERPDDTLHVYATLRGPFMALGDDQLLAFRAKAGSLHPLRNLDDVDGEHAEVVEALSLLAKLHRSRNRRPIADTIGRLLDETRAHAGIAIWPTGEQALANLIRLLDQARRFESRGATSFRAFVDWLDAQAERGDAGQAPVVEEGTEGVRIMTVHKAKGLEFPVVILCDPTVSRTNRRPSRYVDPQVRLWAAPLAGCVPHELRDHEDEVLRADDAEEVRISYVAATRARDILVVPAVGDEPQAGWLDVLHPAFYPQTSERRRAVEAPGCPSFGQDSVLQRPASSDFTPDRSVQPGLHTGCADGHGVVWWDPSKLDLDVDPVGGVRQQDMLMDVEGASPAGIDSHSRWRGHRQQRRVRATTPTIRSGPVTLIAHDEERAIPQHRVDEVRSDADRVGRPRGKRFGTLVHGVLAEVPFDVDDASLQKMVDFTARVVGATEPERAAAPSAVRAALAHPLMQRAARADIVRREVPLTLRLDDGTIVEGIADLAFRETHESSPRWVVVDFKTDANPGDADPAYHRQVAIYASAIADSTGEAADGALLFV